ncbi:MAG: response regulator transcription factor [Gammaproteobacteria bacterium]|jgi:DNA-binding response OmpR family regulator|nr:response regulator transcription factor [Gammaproteobacteria bacterium]
MRVLLAEDDDLLGDGLKTGLKQEGYTVDWVKDGQSAENALLDNEFDLVVLDLGLPKKAGLEVLKQLRNSGKHIPVLILTARDSVQDRVTGLDSGADDYLVKPFDLEELCARLRVLQRRTAGRSAPVIIHGGISLDPAAHKVLLNGDAINLSMREFVLLQHLMENIGRVIPRARLEEKLYGWDAEVESNSLEVFIHHLRKKLGADFIRTVRGVGYMIE